MPCIILCRPTTVHRRSMATTSKIQIDARQDNQVYEQLDKYSWNTDDEFQNGLRAILGSNPTPEQMENLTLRARCFYYSRQAR